MSDKKSFFITLRISQGFNSIPDKIRRVELSQKSLYLTSSFYKLAREKNYMSLSVDEYLNITFSDDINKIGFIPFRSIVSLVDVPRYNMLREIKVNIKKNNILSKILFHYINNFIFKYNLIDKPSYRLYYEHDYNNIYKLTRIVIDSENITILPDKEQYTQLKLDI